MKKWRLLKSDTVLSTPWLSVLENKYEIAEDKIVDDYYIVKRNDFALVIAVEGDKLILVRQYRPATDQFYLALPAGFLCPGESPEVGAQRELLEETGFSAAKCRLIGELHPLPGYIQSKAYVVLCEVSNTNMEELDRSEIEEVLKVNWEEVLQMIVRGDINEMQAVSAILLAKEILTGHHSHRVLPFTK
jgi:ADP-ribose pyrophosphatase